MKNDAKSRARSRLDARLSNLKPEAQYQPPESGWVRAIRDALGMSGSQLGSRLDVRPQTIDALEKSEVAGTVQLGTLRRAAEAMDCTLVYALVPKTSLEDAVQRRSRSIAVRDIERVAHTMKLEDQATSDADLESRIDAYIRDSLKGREIWDEK